jgi:hypothetical protein
MRQHQHRSCRLPLSLPWSTVLMTSAGRPAKLCARPGRSGGKQGCGGGKIRWYFLLTYFLTNSYIQIINQDGSPAFVVIPYDEYVRTFRKTPRIPESGNIPNVVVWLSVDKGYSLARAWREYLGHHASGSCRKDGNQPSRAFADGIGRKETPQGITGETGPGFRRHRRTVTRVI